MHLSELSGESGEFQSAGNNVRLGFYDPTGQYSWGGGNRAYLSQDIPPGGQVSFVFSVPAQNWVGTAQLTCQMLQENVIWFGAMCQTMSISVIPGTAKQTLFSQSTESDATIRTGDDGVAPPFQVALQMNFMGATADDYANNWDAGTWTGFFPAWPYSNYQRSPSSNYGATTAQSYNHVVGMWIDPFNVGPGGLLGNFANITLQKGMDQSIFPWCGPSYILNSYMEQRFETGAASIHNQPYSGLSYLLFDVRSQKYVYLSVQAFDPRGLQGDGTGQFVMHDALSPNYIMLTSYKDGTTFGHRTAGVYIDPSTVTHAWNAYSFSITKAEFETALAALNAHISQSDSACTSGGAQSAGCRSVLLSPYAQDYSLRDIEIGAEVHTDGVNDGYGHLGMAVRNARVGID